MKIHIFLDSFVYKLGRVLSILVRVFRLSTRFLFMLAKAARLIGELKLSPHRIDPAHAEICKKESDLPLVFCLSHSVPWPPRAGNEYRIHRMLSWLRGRGWDVVLLLCLLPGGELNDAQISAVAAQYKNVIWIRRDGVLSYVAERSDVATAVASLAGRQVRDFAAILGKRGADSSERVLASLLETFCPDVLIETLISLDNMLSPEILLINYVLMARGLSLLGSRAFKVIDTHDVFSTKSRKVAAFGVDDGLGLAMSTQDEANLLTTADLIIAIQCEEAEELRQIAPNMKVITVGVDMPIPPTDQKAPERPIILLVASGNPMNTKGLRDFLRFAWPRVIKAIPDAELHVVGAVGAALSGDELGVRWLGHVDDLGSVYAQARLIINPAVAGTGLKIKTLEALAYLRPIVLWPSGVDGMQPALRELCECVTDWFAFTEAVIRLLCDDSARQRLLLAKDQIAEMLSPNTVYDELEKVLRDRFSGPTVEHSAKA
ncbi:hypothetical protein MHY1_p00202 (plasmid) [Methylovirgula sp. HY1]|nr:hypothetical protein MHY1_p00202 [Methylovirgula sp. HY1]